MREITQNINNTINQVKNLTGIHIRLKVNKGRNKIEELEGKVENTYPKIFTVRKTDGELNTYAYSDILSGNILFFRAKTNIGL